MKLSTRSRYGLRLMVEIGAYAKDDYISIKNISINMGISESYLEQLISKLKKQQLVVSVRGSKGGYMLGRCANEISIGEILRTLEGSLAPTDCTTGQQCDCKQHCGVAGKCVTKSVWERIRDGVNEVVDSIFLDELIQDYETDRKLIDYF